MKKNRLESIGKRITYAWHDDSLTIIISQEIPRMQQIMLEVWLIAWCGVGTAVGLEFSGAEGSERTFFLIFLSFWAFFFFRVFKVILWRRIGREMVRITAEGMSVKNAFLDFGKARFFMKENIKKMEVIRRNPAKFIQNLDQSFWIMGGDSIEFTYMRGRFVLGKQLQKKDAMLLAKLIDKGLRKF